MIIKNHITNKQLARDILWVDLIKHNTGKCNCREQNGQVYPCRASEWLRGIVPSKHIVENYFYEKTNH
jgi:hypothetical protein